MIYLDYNATAPVRPEAAAAVARALALPGNPSSVHGPGRAARRMVEDAREQVAALVRARPDQVVFTSGGTEANLLALRGCGRGRLIVSSIEHDSVLAAARGGERLPVTEAGEVRLDVLETMLAEADTPALASVMLANNETGVLQPVAEAAAVARAHGALFHCDAVQAAGKIPVDFAALGVDFLSLSGHKLGAPKGVGALVVADPAGLAPILVGGGQEKGYRAGTENVPGIAGFGAAAEAAGRGLCAWEGVAALRDRLEVEAAKRVPAARIFGKQAGRLPNTSCLALPGLPSETQVMAFDLAGIAISAGSACSSGKVTPSHVLRAMGVAEDLAGSAIRVSLGWMSVAEDVDRFFETWSALYARKSAA